MTKENYVNNSKETGHHSAPPPYHVFEVLGQFFVFDTTGCRFYQIDELPYKYLMLLKLHSMPNAKKIIISEGKYSPEMVEACVDAIQVIGESGLFDIPDYSISEKDIEKHVDNIPSFQHWGIDLMLTEQCNLACSYCFCATSRDLPAEIMSIATIKKAIDMLFKNAKGKKHVDINFFGGEPLLNKKGFKYAIEYGNLLARQNDKKISYRMTTNGTIYDKEIEDLLINNNIPVMISLDGPQNIHDKQCPTRDGGGSFQTAIKTIKRLLELKHTVEIRCTVAHPMPSLLELMEFFESFATPDLRRVVIAPVMNPPYNSTELDFTYEDFKEFAEQSRKQLPWVISQFHRTKKMRYLNFTKEIQGIFNGTFKTQVGAVRCSASPYIMNVSANGKIYPCCRFSGMSKWQTGDIDSGPDYESYKEFWRCYRKQIAHSCSACWAFPICKGPCPWEIHQSDGGFNFPKYCNTTRSHIEDSAYAYIATLKGDINYGK